MVSQKPTPSTTVSSSPVVEVASGSEQKQPSKANKKTIYTILAVVASVIIVFWLASSVLPQVLVYLTRAANQSGQFSLANSYIFGSPLVAQGNGEEKIRVSAFLLDAKGRGVSDQQVSLNVVAKAGTGQPQVNVVQEVTDEFGKAVFEVTSVNVGQYVVSASVGGLEFPQTVTLTYR
jgi:hypothetical protein